MDCRTPGLPVHHQLPEFTKLMFIESVMSYNYVIFCLPLSSCPQSFPASESFLMSQLFPSSGQTIGVSASTSVLPVNVQDWFPSGWTDQISLKSKGLSRFFSTTTFQKHQFFWAQLSLQSNSHISFPGSSEVKASASNVRDPGLIPGFGPWVRSLEQEHPLEMEMATNSSVLAWRIPWTEEPGRLQSTGLQKVKHDFTFTFTFIHDYCKNNSLD